MINVYVIEPDGTVGPRRIEGTRDDEVLNELQTIVGGYIESIALNADAHVYINEDGKGLSLPPNHLATLLVEGYRPGFADRDTIVGTAVILGSAPGGAEGDAPQDVIDEFDRIVSRTLRVFTEPCVHPKGTRVRMTGVMPDDPAPLDIGATGTVTGGNAGQIFVDWDNGRTLILLPTDPYEIIEETS